MDLRDELYNDIRDYIKGHNNYTIDDIILDDKYASFWEADYDIDYNYNYNYSNIIYNIDVTNIKKLMYKYKLCINFIIEYPKLLLIFCSICVITKYTDDEQLCLSGIILNNIKYMYHIDYTLLDHILPLIDYTISGWLLYKKNFINLYLYKDESKSKFDAIRYVNKYIKNIILYDRSLRNEWILSCISILY